MSGLKCRQIDKQTDRKKDRQIQFGGELMSGIKCRQMDKQTDRQKARQIDNWVVNLIVNEWSQMNPLP